MPPGKISLDDVTSFEVFKYDAVTERRGNPHAAASNLHESWIKKKRFLNTTKVSLLQKMLHAFNPLTPNDHYIGRTAPLTSKRCILYIYSTNIGTEYFNL